MVGLKNYLFLFVFILGNVGGLNPQPPKIDSEIQPIFEEWVKDCTYYNIKYDISNLQTITFSDTVNYWVSSYSNPNTIIINERFKTHPTLKVIVYYNLGREVLNLPDDTTDVGIMNPFFDESFAKIYILKWDKYKTRYFDQVIFYNTKSYN